MFPHPFNSSFCFHALAWPHYRCFFSLAVSSQFLCWVADLTHQWLGLIVLYIKLLYDDWSGKICSLDNSRDRIDCSKSDIGYDIRIGSLTRAPLSHVCMIILYHLAVLDLTNVYY